MENAGRQLPRIAAEIQIRPQHVLHGETRGQFGEAFDDRHGFEEIQQRRTHVPRSLRALFDHVIAITRADGNKQRIRCSDVRQKAGEFRDNGIVDSLVEAHQIHLVDRHNEMLDAQQIGNKCMTPRLRQHAVARVDQNNGQIGGRRAGRHIARVLLVAGRIGNDELAFRRGKIAVRDVDCNALFAFGAQAVGEQREIDQTAAGIGRRLDHAGKLVFVDALGIVKQASDESTFTVVNAAGGGETEQRHPRNIPRAS